MDNHLNIKTDHVCRTCMEEIINTSFFHLDFTQVDSEPTIGEKLCYCIPELDLSILPNTVICGDCADTINALYIFKKECLRLEMKICEYIQQVEHTGSIIDLTGVIQFCQPYSKDLTEELTTEVFEKTENLITEFKMEAFEKHEESPTCFSDNYPFNKTEGNTEIANNEYLTSLEMVDRECVLFNTVEDLFNSARSEAEENSGIRNDSNLVNNCPLQIVETFENSNKTDIYFQCFTCRHKAESKLKLIWHMKSHTAKKASQKKMSFKSCKNLFCWYRCDLCNYSTKHKYLFSFHSRVHLTKNNCQSILKSRPVVITNTITFGKKYSKDNKINCGSRSSKKQNLKYWHNIIEESFKSWICKICGYSTNHKYNLNIHMLIHSTDEKRFKCSICEYSCNQKNSLNIHMLSHTGKKPFKCSVCEYSSNAKRNLKLHMLTHTGEKLFKCSVCEYSCNYQQSLYNHMFNHKSEKQFKCSVCEYSCNYKRSLNNHMFNHTGEKPFKCSVCEYSCKEKYSLKIHMLTHSTGEKPFKCSICEFVCNRKSYLKSHMLTHRDEKPFKCSICEYSCKRKAHLQTHILTHAGEKPLFKCSVCEYSCKQQSYFKIHMLTHTNAKPKYKCVSMTILSKPSITDV